MARKQPPKPPADPVQEPRNIAVEALQNRLKIGNAIVAAGPVDFPLTSTEANSLAALGLVRVTGLFSPPSDQ